MAEMWGGALILWVSARLNTVPRGRGTEKCQRVERQGGFWGSLALQSSTVLCKAFTLPQSTGTELRDKQIIPLMLLPAGPMRGGFLICAVSAEQQVTHR